MFGDAVLRKMLKSKIHRAVITDADINYEGSITIDRELMELADLLAYEFVDIWDVTNGNRFSTYIIEGKAGSREICVNGAAARLVAPGDLIIIASSQFVTEDECATKQPKLVFVDEKNNPT